MRSRILIQVQFIIFLTSCFLVGLNISLIQNNKKKIPVFSETFYSFSFYIYFYDPFWISFYIWDVVWIKKSFVLYGYPIFPALFIKMTILFCIFAKNLVSAHVWVYFCCCYCYIGNCIFYKSLSQVILVLKFSSLSNMAILVLFTFQ